MCSSTQSPRHHRCRRRFALVSVDEFFFTTFLTAAQQRSCRFTFCPFITGANFLFLHYSNSAAILAGRKCPVSVWPRFGSALFYPKVCVRLATVVLRFLFFCLPLLSFEFSLKTELSTKKRQLTEVRRQSGLSLSFSFLPPFFLFIFSSWRLIVRLICRRRRRI